MQTSSLGLDAAVCKMVFSITEPPMVPLAPSFFPCTTTSLDVEGCAKHKTGAGESSFDAGGDASSAGVIYCKCSRVHNSVCGSVHCLLGLSYRGKGALPAENSSTPDVRSRHLAPPLLSVARRQFVAGRNVSKWGEKPLRSNEPSSLSSISNFNSLCLLWVKNRVPVPFHSASDSDTNTEYVVLEQAAKEEKCTA